MHRHPRQEHSSTRCSCSPSAAWELVDAMAEAALLGDDDAAHNLTAVIEHALRIEAVQR